MRCADAWNVRPFAMLLVLLLAISPVRSAIAQARPQDKAQIKQDLQRILAQPEFRPDTSSAGPISRLAKSLSDSWDTFARWLRRIFGMDRVEPPAPRQSGGDGLLLYVLIPLFLLPLLAATACLIVRAVRAHGSRIPKRVGAADIDIDTAQADMVTEPDVWLAQARSLARNNDFRRAIRAVFLGAILELDRAGALRIERGRTNGDYLRALTALGLAALHGALEPMSSDFDMRWYGDRATTDADFQQALQRYDSLKELAKRASGRTVEWASGVAR